MLQGADAVSTKACSSFWPDWEVSQELGACWPVAFEDADKYVGEFFGKNLGFRLSIAVYNQRDNKTCVLVKDVADEAIFKRKVEFERFKLPLVGGSGDDIYDEDGDLSAHHGWVETDNATVCWMFALDLYRHCEESATTDVVSFEALVRALDYELEQDAWH